MAKRFGEATIRGLVLAIFFFLNVAIASPASADLTDDICWDEDEPTPCCTYCLLFCECTIVP